MAGPLAQLSVVEFSGLGPAPLAGQLLADLGARVVTVDRASAEVEKTDINRRGKQSIALNLKHPEGIETAKALIARSDVVIEGFRPGVMERLGLGPADCPDTVIYGRMTGWGQDGPWAHVAGHDITYLALSGALYAMGDADRPPVPPMNLAADYGGGTMFLIMGILSAVIERGVSGKGQVVDAAMVEGVPAMMGLIHAMLAQGTWSEDRGSNWLDGSAPFYRCYACADGQFIAVGALEPQFHAIFLERAGLPKAHQKDQNDRSKWAERSDQYAAVFAQKTRDDWAEIFEGSDGCVAPVLRFSEAPDHPQVAARRGWAFVNGVQQAVPAPRFSRSSNGSVSAPRAIGADTDDVLAGLGLTAEAIATLRKKDVLT